MVPAEGVLVLVRRCLSSCYTPEVCKRPGTAPGARGLPLPHSRHCRRRCDLASNPAEVRAAEGQTGSPAPPDPSSR